MHHFLPIYCPSHEKRKVYLSNSYMIQHPFGSKLPPKIDLEFLNSLSKFEIYTEWSISHSIFWNCE